MNVNKLLFVFFSLMSFASLVYRAPAGEPRKIEGKIIFFLPYSLIEEEKNHNFLPVYSLKTKH